MTLKGLHIYKDYVLDKLLHNEGVTVGLNQLCKSADDWIYIFRLIDTKPVLAQK